MGRPAGYILHYEYDLCISFNYIVQFGDIWVVDTFHNFDFSAD